MAFKNASGLKPFENRIWLSSPTKHKEEMEYVTEAFETNWKSTVGKNINEVESQIAEYIGVKFAVGLSAGTAALHLATKLAGEKLYGQARPNAGTLANKKVLIPSYTYTASASAAIHCEATVRFVDIQKDGDPITHIPEMDYEKLEEAISEKTKAIVTVDLGGIVCDYERVFEIVERKRGLFKPIESDGTSLGDLSARIQKAIGRMAVFSDSAHSLGASRVFHGKRKYCGAIADFTDFSFHAVNVFKIDGDADFCNTVLKNAV